MDCLSFRKDSLNTKSYNEALIQTELPRVFQNFSYTCLTMQTGVNPQALKIKPKYLFIYLFYVIYFVPGTSLSVL